MHKKLLILDAGGVLLTEPVPGVLKEMAAAYGVSVGSVEEYYKDCLYDDCWAGVLDGREMWNKLAFRFGGNDGERWSGLFEKRLVLEPGCKRLAAWSSQVDLALLSNHHDYWLKPPLEKQGLWSLFKYCWVSSELSMAKPKPEIYHYISSVTKQYKEVLFVDDAQVNIAEAQKQGINSLLAQSDWVEKTEDWISA